MTTQVSYCVRMHQRKCHYHYNQRGNKKKGSIVQRKDHNHNTYPVWALTLISKRLQGSWMLESS